MLVWLGRCSGPLVSASSLRTTDPTLPLLGLIENAPDGLSPLGAPGHP